MRNVLFAEAYGHACCQVSVLFLLIRCCYCCLITVRVVVEEITRFVMFFAGHQ